MMAQSHRVTESQSRRVAEKHQNEIGTLIVDRAVLLRRNLGLGPLETVYQVTLPPSDESESGRLSVRFPVQSNRRGQGSMIDFEPTGSSRGRGMVERKSVEKSHPARKNQVFTDLRLAGMKVGS
jgi:hypothetical protein